MKERQIVTSGAEAPHAGPPRILDAGRRATLERWTLGHTLFAFDFDGTLAEIVPQPASAHLLPGLHRSLAALALQAPVAVVSGRPRDALLQLLPREIRYCVGNHGNEGLPGSAPHPTGGRSDNETLCQGWVEQLEAETCLWIPLRGTEIENNGATLSLHYRHCTDPQRARAILLARVARLVPVPRVIDGLMVLNLLPPMARTKRDALEALMAHSGCELALFAGDDATDELAFQDAPENWLTIKVGRTRPTHARYAADGPHDMARLIEHMVELRAQALRLAH